MMSSAVWCTSHSRTTPHTWKLKKVAGPRSMAASIDTRFREHTTARIALRAAERRREQIGQAADTRGSLDMSEIGLFAIG